jgi:N-acetylglucosaminyl-diphospho-decaprenol L-rhamnosyltransferase
MRDMGRDRVASRPTTGALDGAPLTRERYRDLVANDDLLPTGWRRDLSVVIVTHESEGHIEACLDSLAAASTLATIEIIVVDNLSTDGTADLVESRYRDVRVVRKRRRSGFATNSNIGIVAASGRHILLLNPDTRVGDRVLDDLVAHLDDHPDVGAVGPSLVYPDGRPQASARRFPTPLTTLVRRTPLRALIAPAGVRRHLQPDKRHDGSTSVDWLLGAAIALRREAIDDVAGLDDGFRLYCEDIDLCWRLHERGWQLALLDDSVVEHALGELTAKRFLTVRTIWHFRSMLRFIRLHGVPGRPRVPAAQMTSDAGAEPQPTDVDVAAA